MTATLEYATPAAPLLPAVKSARLMSLDAFRGATIAGMILVNNPGSWSHMYSPLEHAEWHGLTPTDWIFPFFLFIVGVAIPFSQGSRNVSTKLMIFSIVRRSLILIALGFAIGMVPYSMSSGVFAGWATRRIPGVLQRIGVCYFAVAMLSLFVRSRGMVAALLLVLTTYSVLMLAVPAPGFARGDLSPQGNLEHYIDVQVFGKHVYGEYADPEGLLSTLPAIGTVICGWLVGTWLRRTDKSHTEKIAAVFSAGVAALIVGSILSAGLMPLNKKIWTPSFTIYTAGLACLGLGFCYWMIDIQGWRRWATPLVAMGMNAITIFVLSGVIARLSLARLITPATAEAAARPAEKMAVRTWLYNTLFVPYFSPLNASLAWALCWVAGFVLLALWMKRMKIFIKV